MEKRQLVKGEIVQLNPETCRNPAFRGRLMIITEPKAFGAQGYIQGFAKNTGEDLSSAAYYRAEWTEMEFTGGSAPYVLE